MAFKRFLFISLIFLISVGCLLFMNQEYDPLARYPYELTTEQHNKIVKNLTNKEINYLIEYSIQPSEYIDFVDIPGFNIYAASDYIKLYDSLKEYTDRKTVVQYYNTVTRVFGKDAVEPLLSHYFLHEIVNYYADNPDAAPLVIEASSLTLYLDQNHCVGYYMPKEMQPLSITTLNNQPVRLRSVATEAFEEMYAVMQTELKKKEIKLFAIEHGWLAYDTLLKQDSANKPGTNDYQLGLSLAFALTNQQNFADSAAYTWLKENAYKYGYVQYTKTDATHWRYVGKEAAMHLYIKQLTFEASHE